MNALGYLDGGAEGEVAAPDARMHDARRVASASIADKDIHALLVAGDKQWSDFAQPPCCFAGTAWQGAACPRRSLFGKRAQDVCAGFSHGDGLEGRWLGRARAGVEQDVDDRRDPPVVECGYVADDGFHSYTVTCFDLVLYERLDLAGIPVEFLFALRKPCRKGCLESGNRGAIALAAMRTAGCQQPCLLICGKRAPLCMESMRLSFPFAFE